MLQPSLLDLRYYKSAENERVRMKFLALRLGH